MRVTATPAARRTVERVAAEGRDGLVLILGTGCCDSTAPFLYDRYEPGPDAVPVGEVAGVPGYAQRWLAGLYRDAEGLQVDVDESVLSDSLSLESEHGCRFTLKVSSQS